MRVLPLAGATTCAPTASRSASATAGRAPSPRRCWCPTRFAHAIPEHVSVAAAALVEPGGNSLRAVRAAGARGGGLACWSSARAPSACWPRSSPSPPAPRCTWRACGRSSLALAASLGVPHTWRLDELAASPDSRFDAVIDATSLPSQPGARRPAGQARRAAAVFIGSRPAPSVLDTRELVLKDVTAVGILSASPGLAGAIESFADGAVAPDADRQRGDRPRGRAVAPRGSPRPAREGRAQGARRPAAAAPELPMSRTRAASEPGEERLVGADRVIAVLTELAEHPTGDHARRARRHPAQLEAHRAPRARDAPPRGARRPHGAGRLRARRRVPAPGVPQPRRPARARPHPAAAAGSRRAVQRDGALRGARRAPTSSTGRRWIRRGAPCASPRSSAAATPRTRTAVGKALLSGEAALRGRGGGVVRGACRSSGRPPTTLVTAEDLHRELERTRASAASPSMTRRTRSGINCVAIPVYLDGSAMPGGCGQRERRVVPLPARAAGGCRAGDPRGGRAPTSGADAVR